MKNRGRVISSILVLITLAGFGAAAEPESMFPFALPWDDASGGVTNLSALLHKPAGKFGPVRAGPDGHLYAGEQRIRFFGVDLAFDANVPTHADAEKVAARLARFGVNIVRFHIMDMQRFPRGILARDGASTRDLDPEALDRLDYFTAQLIRNGIYVNLCLLNYRPINAADGLPREIEQPNDHPFQRRHVVGFFNRQVLELQKEYAQKLLAHRNAYTGRAYAQEPGVAFVEINNENGLIHAWLGKQVDQLADVFRDELARQWNQWLRTRYKTPDALQKAWNQGARPQGDEMLTNGGFAEKMRNWTLEVHPGAGATATIEDAALEQLPGARAARIMVTKPGAQSYFIRFEQPGVRTQASRPLQLNFWAKADKPCTLRTSIEQTHEPWHVLSHRADVALMNRWKQYGIVLPISESDDKARLIFDPPMEACSFAITAVSLKESAIMGLKEQESLGSVPLFKRPDLGDRTPAVQRDFLRFLWETEDGYWQAMQRFLKQDLNVKALVIGTAVGYSTPNLMAKLDCVDTHAYWQHPVFPGRPWDPSNWSVNNVSMVNSPGGLVSQIAQRRVLGKPFCITEYGHCAPSTYVAEGHLLRAAYSAFQDWDYISSSRYSHTSNWAVGRIENYFDMNAHPIKMATLIPAAAMFLRGDVEAGRKLVVAGLDTETELELLRRAHEWELVHAGHVGISREATLVHRVAIAALGQAPPAGAIPPDRAQAPADRFVSDTGQLDWNLQDQRRGVVTINSPRSKAVIGFAGGKRFDLSGVIVEPGPTLQEGWSVITITAIEGDLARAPRRILITATGSVENTNMGWKNAERSSVGKDWGQPPTRVEGIGAKITFGFHPSNVTAWALDERGQRRQQIDLDRADNNTILNIGPAWKTIWYELETGR